jgi:hypothetical protein
VQIASLLSPFHIRINNSGRIFWNIGDPVMEIPEMEILENESFCQQNKNQLDTIKYAEYFTHHIFCNIFPSLTNILQYFLHSDLSFS